MTRSFGAIDEDGRVTIDLPDGEHTVQIKHPSELSYNEGSVEYTYSERPPDVRDGPLEYSEMQADTPGPIWENLDEEVVVFENDGGETVTLVTGIGTDTETTYHWGYRRPIWNRRGDTVSVFDADEHLVLQHSY